MADLLLERLMKTVPDIITAKEGVMLPGRIMC